MTTTFSVNDTLRGRHLLMTGVTGFVGKAFLAWVLYYHPDIKRITCIVRPKSRQKPVDRLAGVLQSAPLRVLRDRHGETYDAFVAEKVNAVAGDLSKPRIGLSDEDLARLKGDVDVIVNVAASVDFTPPLNDALQTNVEGALGALDAARFLGVPLAHVSTCYVAGYANGWVPEQVEPGCPNPDITSFDPDLERKLAHRTVTRILEDKDDPTQPPPRRRLRTDGEARSRALGWPNTYTYTKSLAEKVMTRHRGDVPVCIVRPAIVESAWKFPLPGWSEGGNGSAALIMLAMWGQRFTPAKGDLAIDLVPVDLVAKGLALAVAALLRGEHRPVYQLGTSDENPLWIHRLIEICNMWKYQRVADDPDMDVGKRLLLTQMDALPNAPKLYENASVPAIRKAAGFFSDLLADAPAPDGILRRFKDRAKAVAQAVERTARGVEGVYDVYRPFALDVEVRYKTANIHALSQRVVESERALYAWDVADMDWYRYFHDQHLPGLDEWIWPEMERKLRQGLTPDEPAAPQFPGDLIDLFERSVAEHGGRTCFARVGEGRAETLTFDQVHARAQLIGQRLVGDGVHVGDRVMLVIDRGVEWPLAWLGVLYAGGACVPVDPATPADSIARLVERSQAKVLVMSRAQASKAPPHALVRVAEELCAGPRSTESLPSLHGFDHTPGRTASILFTSGTTGVPRGVVLTHTNFLAVLKGIWHVYAEPNQDDRFLSLLPLHHSFEFVAGLLFPIARGASVHYPVKVSADGLGELLDEVRPTAMVGVPAVWSALQRKIARTIDDLPLPARKLWRMAEKRAGQLRDETGINVGPILFGPVHKALGGDLKHLVSGGAALPEVVLQDFYRWGFSLTSGYGLTEAAPVLTVAPPGTKRGDSVGPPIGGVEIKIFEAGTDGVGEVIAKGQNVMSGYLEDEAGTKEAVRGGWLHTGDLGRIDEDGHVVIVGRKKEVIVAQSGENVYPDELEERLVNLPDVEELSVVGLPDGLGGEKVAVIVVPKDLLVVGTGGEQSIRRAIGERTASLPSSWRPSEIRIRKEPLPRTATMKVSRARLRTEEGTRTVVAPIETEIPVVSNDGRWLLDAMAKAAGKSPVQVTATTRLGEDLPLDSLAWMDLATLIERKTGAAVAVDELAAMATVGEVVEAVTGRATRKKGVRVQLFYGPDGRAAENAAKPSGPIPRLPDGMRKDAQNFIRRAHATVSGALFDIEVTGQAFIPEDRAVLVVANHSSHLDSGVLRHALGKLGDDLPLLAAQDYFFGTAAKDLIFGDLLDLVPADRHKTGLAGVRTAVRILESGRSLAIFPEGTRSRDGVVLEFKPGAVLIALQAHVDVLLVHVEGSHDVLPVGATVPRLGGEVRVRVGRAIPNEWIERRVRDEGSSMQEVADVLRTCLVTLSRGGDTIDAWQALESHKEVSG